MAYKVIILYRLYMPSYFLGTFTEYPKKVRHSFFKCLTFFMLRNKKSIVSGSLSQ